MGKTIRRKNATRNGMYDWRNEERNDPKAGENYFHSDMPNRNGRGAVIGKGCKEEAAQHRRTEMRILKGRIAREGEEVLHFKDDRHSQSKSNQYWHWS